MPELRLLVVCTGNTCRSPMGEAILRARLDAAGVDASVASAGTLGWSGRAATPHAVAAMAEFGLDIGDHVSRRLDNDDLDADLVVAMTRIHAGAVIGRSRALKTRVFLPSEFARLAAGSGPPPTRAAGRQGPAGSTVPAVDEIRVRIAAVGAMRGGELVGRPSEEVDDPVGEPFDAYRATAHRLDRDLGNLVDALVGQSAEGRPQRLRDGPAGQTDWRLPD